MKLDTSKIYVAIDGTNGTVTILLPKDCKIEVVELRLDERDPCGPAANDIHEFALLREDMREESFDL